MESKVVMKPKEILDEQLLTIIDKYVDDKDLKAILNKKFLEKSMPSSTVNLIFSGEKQISILDDFEKLNLIFGINERFPNLKINEKEFFSDKVINSYKNFIKIDGDRSIDRIDFDNFVMMNDFEYIGAIDYKTLKDLRECNKIIYQLGVQREPKYKKIGNKRLAVPSVDDDAIVSIKNAMKENYFEDSTITLGYLLKEDEITPKIVFEGEKVGRIKADNLIIVDGAHRILAMISYMIDYYAEFGHYPIGKQFSVKIVIGDATRLKRIVTQSFKRSKEVTSEYLEGLNDDDYNKFVDRVVNNSNFLMNKVAITYDQMKAFNKITTTKVIKEAIEILNINVSNKSVVMFTTKKIADSLDILLDLIKENDININYYNLYTAFVYFACKVNEFNNDLQYYELFINKLINIDKKDIKKLKLGNKNYNAGDIIKYFDVF